MSNLHISIPDNPEQHAASQLLPDAMKAAAILLGDTATATNLWTAKYYPVRIGLNVEGRDLPTKLDNIVRIIERLDSSPAEVKVTVNSSTISVLATLGVVNGRWSEQYPVVHLDYACYMRLESWIQGLDLDDFTPDELDAGSAFIRFITPHLAASSDS
jgi:hypothetical protein